MSAELDRLIQRYIDGVHSAGELLQLNALLLADAEARRRFSEWLNVDSAIAAVAAGWEPQPQTVRKVVAFRTTARWLAAAAALLLLLGGGWWWRTQRTFATVLRDAGVEELAAGIKLRGEKHELKGGTVELMTALGARVVIEAPAEFRFESAQRLRVMHGRVAAEVPPPAKGFTVVTASGDAVDLGTRFGVDVPVDGAAEIHVFQGEVVAKASGNPRRQSLHGGDAVTMRDGASATRELRSSAFIQPDEVSSLTAGLAAGQQARAETALAALKRDPALIALLDFESNTPLPGTFRRVQGRWPGSHAPEFINEGDHLNLDVGGGREWPQLTLAAWVRLDRLGAPYQSLLHTDGWDKSNPGQVHWMVTKHATMRLALFGDVLTPGSVEREGYPDSQTSVLPGQGRWMHLVTVYDARAATVRFYLNGVFDSETHLQRAYPAKLGPAQIGNWNRQDRKLSGRVDELVLLGRAMSDHEVRALYEAGNPYAGPSGQ